MPTWIQPSTWAANTIVRSTFLDEQIKGNMDYVGTTHRHSTGTAGEGAGFIGPVAWSDYKGAVPPAAPTNATLFRVIATATNIGFMNSASATFYFGDTAHEHVIGTGTATFGTLAATVEDQPPIIMTIVQNALGTVSTSTASATATIGGSGSRAVFAVGNVAFQGVQAGTVRSRIELSIDGVIQKSADVINTVVGTAGANVRSVSTLFANVASGSVTYSVTGRLNTATANQGIIGANIDFIELKIQ